MKSLFAAGPDGLILRAHQSIIREQIFMRFKAFLLWSLMAGWVAGSGPARGALLPAGDFPVQTNLPDPLVNAAGQRITDAAQWAARREEMKQIIEDNAVGHAPPPPGNVTGQVLATEPLLDGQAEGRFVHLAFGPDHQLGFDVVIFLPAGTNASAAPYPTAVQPVFRPLTGPGVAGTNGWDTAVQGYAPVLQRGYAVLIFYYQQCGLDNSNWPSSGFFPAYPGYNWRDIGAWAWSMSRCVDYLETQPWADKSALLAVGHSRLGKTALVAGALDERFALVAPAGSGCGGTGAYRFNGRGRGGREGLEDVVKHFPRWFLPRLGEFSGQVQRLPFDQNWLMALTAPRLLLATDGLNDPNTSYNALIQSYRGAKPVYALLGVPAHLGVNFRPGGHRLDPEDWRAILDFADQQLRGRKVDRRFDTYAWPPPVVDAKVK